MSHSVAELRLPLVSAPAEALRTAVAFASKALKNLQNRRLLPISTTYRKPFFSLLCL